MYVANFASNVREGASVFSNPSGTQQALTLQGTTGGALLSALFGRLDIAAGIAGVVGSANLSARLMANQTFVRWLAVSTKVPPGAFAAQLNTLANIAKQTKDEDIALAVAILEEDPQQ